MASLEERVAYLEGRGEEHAGAIGEVRLDVRDLRAEMNRRFDHVDAKFNHVDAKFNHMDTKFTWMIGFQFATLLAAISALLNLYFR